jgi:DNA-binding transcriptional LysR family regulator
VDLLVRQHRRIALTLQGERLAACVAAAFNQIDQLLLDILGESKAKRLRLRLLPSLALRWLVPRLSSFYALHPDIAIDMATESEEPESLENVDFAIRLGNGHWEDAEADHLFDDALVPVCAPKLGKNLKNPQDLTRQVWLHSMIRPDAWSAWLDGRGLRDLRGLSDMHFANAAILCQAAAEGLGVAIVQRSYVETDLAEGKLVAPYPVYGRPHLAYWLVCPKRKADWPTIKLFRAWIRETLKPRTTERARARSPLNPANLGARAPL